MENNIKLKTKLENTIKENNYVNPIIEIHMLPHLKDEGKNTIVDIDYSIVSIGIIVNDGIVWDYLLSDKCKYDEAREYCEELYDYLSEYFEVELNDVLKEISE